MTHSKKLSIAQLKDLMSSISEYGLKTGKYYPRSGRVFRDLKNPDPFVVYRASQMARFLLQDTLLYH